MFIIGKCLFYYSSTGMNLTVLRLEPIVWQNELAPCWCVQLLPFLFFCGYVSSTWLLAAANNWRGPHEMTAFFLTTGGWWVVIQDTLFLYPSKRSIEATASKKGNTSVINWSILLTVCLSLIIMKGIQVITCRDLSTGVQAGPKAAAHHLWNFIAQD